jgi:hypothetical protein
VLRRESHIYAGAQLAVEGGMSDRMLDRNAPGRRSLVDSHHAAGPLPGKRTRVETDGREIQASARPAKEDHWTHVFRGAPSRQVGVIARVAVPHGLHVRLAPGSARSHHTLPFDELVQIERTTTEASLAERWAYVVAPSRGVAGFVEERFLMWNPPEPSAKLHHVEKGETLGGIVERAYAGHIGQGHDERLYCQAVYLANRGNAGIHLDHVDLSTVDSFLRGEEEQKTLAIYKGVKVIAGDAIWLPSPAFVLELQRRAKASSGQTAITHAWDGAKHAVHHVVDQVRYGTGLVVGFADGIYLAFKDLFKGALQMAEAVMHVLMADMTGLVKMGKHWLQGFQQLWDHRGQVAHDFLAKWNAHDAWARGRFQGEVIGWLLTNVIIVILTAGEASEGVLAAIATRFSGAVSALRLVSDLGDVTTYVRAADKVLELPPKARRFLHEHGTIPSDVQIANNARGHARFRNEWHAAHKLEEIVALRKLGGRRYRFVVADDNELQSLEDVLHHTAAWQLRDTIKLSPRGVAALRRAVHDYPHHELAGVLQGKTSHAHATLAGGTLVLHLG